MKNKLYIAEWPDGTITILSAKNKQKLFWALDEESDPYAAKITELDFEDHIHIRTNSKSDIKWSVDWDTKKKTIQTKKKNAFGSLPEMLGMEVEYDVPVEAYKEMGFKIGTVAQR